jgi:rod shape-determining protein MreD
MSKGRRLSAVGETLLLPLLGAGLVLATTIPLGGALVPPDLLYCLLVAWVVRRPARTPLLLVVALGLFADMMLSRPIGLGALGLVLVVETFRQRAILFHSAPFPMEWGVAVGAFAAMLAAMHLALSVVFANSPGLGPLLRLVASTAVAYPLVVLGLGWCLGVRTPKAVAE